MTYYNPIILMAKSSVSFSYDTDAQAFITATGISNGIQKSAINQLVLDLKAATIWNKIYALYPLIGGTSASHKFNLKDPRDLDIAFRLTFGGGLTHNSNGITPDGTSGYADTHIIPLSIISLNSVALQFYSGTTSTSVGYDVGCRGSSTSSRLDLIIKYSDNNSYIALNNNDTSIGNIVSDSAGLFTASRTTSTVTSFYKNSTSLNTNTTASNTLSSNAISLFSNNDNGTRNSFCNRDCRGAAIMQGLSSTEVIGAYNAWQNYQTLLTRNL